MADLEENTNTETNENSEVVENVNEVENVNGNEHTESKERELPWKKKEEEQKIPYSRFREVNEEKASLRDKLTQTEAELNRYREREQQVTKVAEPTDLNIDDFPDIESYLRAFQELVINKAQIKFQADLETREAEKAHQRAINERDTNFVANVHEAAKYNPEIINAVDYFANILAKSPIHPAIENEIMLDEHAGELIYEITTDPELMKELYTSDPAVFVRKLLKMSAKITRDEAKAQGTNNTPTLRNTGIAQTQSKLAQLKATIPTSVRPTVTGSSRSLATVASKGTMADYRKARAKQ